MLSLQEHIRDIAGLDNEDTAVTLITLMGTGSAAPTDSAPVGISEKFDYSIDGIVAFHQDPNAAAGAAGANMTRLKFNFEQSGEKGNVFEKYINMGMLLNSRGGGSPIYFHRGMYRLYAGRTLTLSLKTDGTGAWSGATVDVGVGLICSKVSQQLINKIRKGLAQGG